MPAQRLGNQAVKICQYDVAGEDSAGAAGHFVRHVGLSSTHQNGIRSGDVLPLTHMGPPLAIEGNGCQVHTVGTASLSADEIQQIRLFVYELSGEYVAHRRRVTRGQYIIRPHADVYSESD